LPEPNFPNPFNSETSLRFVVPGAPGVDAVSRRVTLVVTDLLGQKVRTLVDDALYPGAHYALWDGTDDAGRKMAGGVYFWSIFAPGFSATQRMVMVH
jgi:flagellar hook assembly protein FlgD